MSFVAINLYFLYNNRIKGKRSAKPEPAGQEYDAYSDLSVPDDPEEQMLIHQNRKKKKDDEEMIAQETEKEQNEKVEPFTGSDADLVGEKIGSGIRNVAEKVVHTGENVVHAGAKASRNIGGFFKGMWNGLRDKKK